jgi:hypothetical protein
MVTTVRGMLQVQTRKSPGGFSQRVHHSADLVSSFARGCIHTNYAVNTPQGDEAPEPSCLSFSKKIVSFFSSLQQVDKFLTSKD